MKTSRRTNPIPIKAGILGVLGTIACSCTSPGNVDYDRYARMPSKPTAVVCRAALKGIPYTRDRAFYGNYGGSGCTGGMPVDEMDECFRRHDVVYSIGKTRRTMRLADHELVRALRELDDEALSEEGREYRDRAIRFFESPAADLLGKPLTAGLWRSEPENSYFHDPETVREFFRPSNAGIPELGTGSTRGTTHRVGSAAPPALGRRALRYAAVTLP